MIPKVRKDIEFIPSSYKGERSHLLDYDVWQEEATQSAVSFAAIAFEAE